MQASYVFSELATGLRRNVSMTVAVIVTLFVSLTLVGLGLLLNAQADKAEKYWGDRLQITAFMCTDNSVGANCLDGAPTEAQTAQVVAALDSSKQVKTWYAESNQTAYEKWKVRYTEEENSDSQVVEAIRPQDFAQSYWITLKDPREFDAIQAELTALPGVASMRDLREVLQPIYFWISAFKWGALVIALFLLGAAILQVGNTIRLAAYARRKEIGIMRLVGASSLYIQLPFLLESLFAALVGVLLAAGALSLFLYVVVDKLLRPNSNLVEWIDWGDAVMAFSSITVVGLALTLIPTLILTRRYLNV